jgi:methionyl-tRNA formyltransferase
MTIVFMGTPQFAVPVLEALAQGGYDIAAVYTRPDEPAGRGRHPQPPPVKLVARNLGVTVCQPAGLGSEEVVEGLASLKPLAIVVCAYGRILRQAVLDIPPKGVLNVHPSLLPRYRGASPITAAILAGDPETGVTIMLMDAGMDTGPILAQRYLPVSPLDTTATLTDKLARLAANLLIETLRRWLTADIQPQPQDHAQATIAPKLRKEDGVVDWSEPAVGISRRVRAYNPWPGASTYLEGQLLHIWEAWPLPHNTDTASGTVVSLDRLHLQGLPQELPRVAFGVQTGDGVLAILRAQRAGRRALAAADFLRGMPNLLGRRLATRRQG